jgi:hypothetical protein
MAVFFLPSILKIRRESFDFAPFSPPRASPPPGKHANQQKVPKPTTQQQTKT